MNILPPTGDASTDVTLLVLGNVALVAESQGTRRTAGGSRPRGLLVPRMGAFGAEPLRNLVIRFKNRRKTRMWSAHLILLFAASAGADFWCCGHPLCSSDCGTDVAVLETYLGDTSLFYCGGSLNDCFD